MDIICIVNFPVGAYVSLPLGKTRFWLLGPEGGKKVSALTGHPKLHTKRLV